jgi:Mn-dependent DtxR family transcriptional regulator
MSIDTEVLRAMLRLARRRTEASEAELALRVRAAPSQVRAALRRLSAAGRVDLQRGSAARLTLEGLTLAVALVPHARLPAAPALVRSCRAA